LRDLHSAFVQAGRLPLDKYLFNLQATTIVKLPRGGERDEVLATNLDVDPLAYVRPETFSSILTGRPAGARTQRRDITPRSSLWPEYRVKGSELTGKGPYQVNVKLIAAMVPSNLIRSIQFVGFDYGMSAKQVADAVTEGQLLLYDKTVTIGLDGPKTIRLAEK